MSYFHQFLYHKNINIALHFRLEPGDIILTTDTLAGVGVLNIGDNLKLELNNSCLFNYIV